MGARKAITVTDDLIWKRVVEKERVGGQAWNDKWGWILDEYKRIREDLAKVKLTRKYVPPPHHGTCPCRMEDCHCPLRTTWPHPETTAQEIGWLSTRKEFQLEVFGPYPPLKIPLYPPEQAWLHEKR